MPKAKLSILWLLIPLLIVLTTTVFQELFSELTNKYFDDLGKSIGYKLLLLICLFLIAGICSLALYYFSIIRHNEIVHEITEEDKKPAKDIYKETHEKKLKNLTRAEKQILGYSVMGEKRFVVLNTTDESVEGLKSQSAIFFEKWETSSHGKYKIADWVWNTIKENPKILD